MTWISWIREEITACVEILSWYLSCWTATLEP